MNAVAVLKQLISTHMNKEVGENGRVVAPGLIEFDIPRSERNNMPFLFTKLDEARSKNSEMLKNVTCITDVSISLATLEDVFLNLSRSELEAEAQVDLAANATR